MQFKTFVLQKTHFENRTTNQELRSLAPGQKSHVYHLAPFGMATNKTPENNNKHCKYVETSEPLYIAGGDGK